MAGDWIKMRADLLTHPKVVRIASALKADNLRTVGGLMSVWCLFDAHSIDGSLDYTPEALDLHLRWEGFAQAMAAVKWLEISPEKLSLPQFDTHNGASAKRRAQDADRKREVRNLSASDADNLRTREEKRREEKKEKKTPSAPRPADAPPDEFHAEPQPSAPPVLTITTNTGKPYPIHQELIDDWTRDFPGVSVLAELRHARAWCEASPTRRKTAGGMKRFLVGWLGRSHDRSGSRQPAAPSTNRNLSLAERAAKDEEAARSMYGA